ncbi:hypothetical protein ACQPYE_36095 [Actinosynnema sp. CA-299493]
MPFSVHELVLDLRRLRTGRGLRGRSIGEVAGPALRELCGIGETDDHALIRDKVGDKLHELSETLPTDLRDIVRTALVLQADVEAPFLVDRIRYLAGKYNRDERTIRRRVDDALTLLAENAMGFGPPGQRSSRHWDWSVRRLETVLRLDRPTPECFERRTVVAGHDGLDLLEVSLPLWSDGTPERSGHEPEVEVYWGAELVRLLKRGKGHFAVELRLPGPLAAGEAHDYGLVIRYPDDRSAVRHYFFSPERPCGLFELRVRFQSTDIPADVRIMAGASYGPDQADHFIGSVKVDSVHEVHAVFTDPSLGLTYGMKWTW